MRPVCPSFLVGADLRRGWADLKVGPYVMPAPNRLPFPTIGYALAGIAFR